MRSPTGKLLLLAALPLATLAGFQGGLGRAGDSGSHHPELYEIRHMY